MEDFYAPVELVSETNYETPLFYSDSAAYNAAKLAKVGSRVKCPSCGNYFIKKYYQQAFDKNKGSGNCKDRYWNQTPKRIERTLIYQK